MPPFTVFSAFSPNQPHHKASLVLGSGLLFSAINSRTTENLTLESQGVFSAQHLSIVSIPVSPTARSFSKTLSFSMCPGTCLMHASSLLTMNISVLLHLWSLLTTNISATVLVKLSMSVMRHHDRKQVGVILYH